MSSTLQIRNLIVEGEKPSGECFRIVDNVSVEAKPGEIVALIGESGAGKTTVALSALGYSRPGTRIVQGQVYIGETDILALNPEQRRGIRGKRVAYVAQSAAAALNPVIPLGEQIVEALLVHNMVKAEAGRRRAVELLRLLDLPEPETMVQRYPFQVSGGQQQRVMVAMAMSCLPEFLVFDEPTTALDVTTQIEVLRAIREIIRERETGAIYISHDLAVVAQVADRIVVMHEGRIVEEGHTEEILKSPREEYTRQLLRAVRLVPGGSGDFATERIGKTRNETPLLELKDIRASYEKGSWMRPVSSERHILHGVDLTLASGEVVALVGESGSGKSTLARVIAGLLAPVSGEIMFQGTPLHPNVRKRALDQLRRIQIIFQSPETTLNPEHRIEDVIGRPLELYFGLKGNHRRKRIEELLTMVDLPPEYVDRFPSELSGGESQRISIARAFAAEPDVILCDEILSSLDTLVGTAILDLIKDLQKRLRVAYLFISHDLATVASIANRVVVLYGGCVCEEGPTHKVFSPPHHPYTALLISSVPELRCGWLKDVLDSRSDPNRLEHGEPVSVECGCRFGNRCPLVERSICDHQPPPRKKISEDHTLWCHRKIDDLVNFQLSKKD